MSRPSHASRCASKLVAALLTIAVPPELLSAVLDATWDANAVLEASWDRYEMRLALAHWRWLRDLVLRPPDKQWHAAAVERFCALLVGWEAALRWRQAWEREPASVRQPQCVLLDHPRPRPAVGLETLVATWSQLVVLRVSVVGGVTSNITSLHHLRRLYILHTALSILEGWCAASQLKHLQIEHVKRLGRAISVSTPVRVSLRSLSIGYKVSAPDAATRGLLRQLQSLRALHVREVDFSSLVHDVLDAGCHEPASSIVDLVVGLTDTSEDHTDEQAAAVWLTVARCLPSLEGIRIYELDASETWTTLSSMAIALTDKQCWKSLRRITLELHPGRAHEPSALQATCAQRAIALKCRVLAGTVNLCRRLLTCAENELYE